MARQRSLELRDYGPGKFGLVVDQIIYQLSLDWSDNTLSSDDGSSDTLMKGPVSYDMMEDAAKEVGETLTRDEEQYIRQHGAGWIVSEDSQGFVSVEGFAHSRSLENRWNEIEEWYGEQDADDDYDYDEYDGEL